MEIEKSNYLFVWLANIFFCWGLGMCSGGTIMCVVTCNFVDWKMWIMWILINSLLVLSISPPPKKSKKEKNRQHEFCHFRKNPPSCWMHQINQKIWMPVISTSPPICRPWMSCGSMRCAYEQKRSSLRKICWESGKNLSKEWISLKI